MSMNRFANAGPIMAGLAAMSDEGVRDAPAIKTTPVDFQLEMFRLIENLADQLSEVAAQMVDIRKRLDAIEKAPPHQLVDVRGNPMTIEQMDALFGYKPKQQGGLLNNEALQAQQSAYYQQFYGSKLG